MIVIGADTHKATHALAAVGRPTAVPEVHLPLTVATSVRGLI
jgi:hypothetical protein